MTNKDSHHTLTYHHMRKLFIGIWLLGATVCQAQNIGSTAEYPICHFRLIVEEYNPR